MLHTAKTAAIAFVDATLPDLETLLAGLAGKVETHLLNRDQDGLVQMADYLDGKEAISALHLIAHGAPGQLFLGNSTVDREKLQKSRAEIEAIANALAEDGELLIYGCEVAAQRKGRLFIDTLMGMTGLKISAATGKVGSAEMGGTWQLDAGNTISVQSLEIPAWQGTLVNTPPVLDNSKSPTLGNMAANAAAPTNGSTNGSVLVSSLIDNGGSLSNFTDSDSNLPGVAITGVSTSGSLYYTTNGGTTWTQLTGTVSAASALTLLADADTRVYFKPNAGYSGSLSDAITFKAWDQTGSFTNGQTGVGTSPDPAVISTIADRSLANTVIGNTLIAANWGGTLKVYNIADKANPALLTTVSGGGSDSLESLEIAGSLMIGAQRSAGFQIFNISTPTAPTHVSLTDTPAQVQAATISGNYAYVVEWSTNAAFRIYDITNPASPQARGTQVWTGIADTASPMGIAVSGNYAFVASSAKGLKVIDISNKWAPSAPLSFFDTSNNTPYDIKIVGNYAYLPSGPAGLRVVDISTPTNPTEVALIDTAGYASKIAIDGNRLYLADQNSAQRVFDISTPASPVELGALTSVTSAFSASAAGNYLYVPDNFSGTRIVDVTMTPVTAFSSAQDTANLTVTLNSPPAADLNGAGTGNNHSTALPIGLVTSLPIAPDATLSDADATNLSSLTVTLTNRPDGDGVESLSLDTAAQAAATGLTVAYTQATGVLSITGNASVATYQSILRGVTYSNTDNAADVTPGTRTITVIANDGMENSTSRTTTVTVQSPPTVTSASYDANTGTLVVTGTNLTALAGAGNDIDASKLTLTGEGGATYTLTDTPDVDISSATAFTLVLSATDKAALNQILNKDGGSSTDGTSLNVAAADDWNAGLTAGDTADASGNGITVSNVPAPQINGVSYDASTGVLTVTGTGFVKSAGANNDIDVSKLTITGEGGTTRSLSTSDVEITSGTTFSITLNAADRAAVEQIINKNGAGASGGTSFNLAAAEDWARGAAPAVTIADLTNGITASNVPVPTITSATYDTGTGALVVTGTGLVKKDGLANDIDISKLQIVGQGGAGAAYTISSAVDVEITGNTSFTVTLAGVDKAGVNALLNKNGTSANDHTSYNLAALDDWAAGADSSLNIADTANNGITVSVYVPPADPAPAPTQSTTVDGATVTTGTTSTSDGRIVDVVTVAPISNNRQEQTGDAGRADIALYYGDQQKDVPVTQASLPTGIGLTATGARTPSSNADALQNLITLVNQVAGSSENNRPSMESGGKDFLTRLEQQADKGPLIINSIKLTVANGQTTAPDKPITISGTPNSTVGAPVEAIVIDTRNLPAGTVLELKNVEFAVIIGDNVTLRGGDGANIVFAGSGSQNIVLGPDDDELHGGDGDDFVGSEGGNDKLFGDAGNDTLRGGADNDTLDGGSGTDTALYTGALADYRISRLADGRWQVKDLRNSADNEGTDLLKDIEQAKFADQTIRIGGDYDLDRDAIPDYLESGSGTNPNSKDNNIFGNSKLFVMQLYRDILFREADEGGLKFWQTQLDSGTRSQALVTANFLQSAEFQAGAAAVTRLYFGALDRLPDDAGLDSWMGAMQSGTPLSAVASSFIASKEFTERFGAQDNAALVDQMYQNVMRRAADTEGKAYWLQRLEAGMSKGDLVLGFTESSEYQAGTAAKVGVSLNYAGLLGRSPEQGGIDFWLAKQAGGMSQVEIIGSFQGTQEYHDRFLP